MKEQGRSDRKLRDIKSCRKLADKVRGSYAGYEKDVAIIDGLSVEELRERCKILLKANQGLIRERNELPLNKRSRSTQTELSLLCKRRCD